MSAQSSGHVSLLQPIAADLPCGEDLEDTPLLASFDVFRVFGQRTLPDPAPEWNEIRSKSLEALTKSKDLRLLAHLGTAALRTDGLAAFSETLQIASHWLETYWSSTYPPVDDDAILRRNALNCFADQVAVIDALRRLPLVSSRTHGVYSVRDIDIARGQLQPSDRDARADERQIDAAFLDAPLQELQELQQAASRAIDAVRRIETVMNTQSGAEAVPAFDPLATQLIKIDRVLRGRLAARGDGQVDPVPEETETVGPTDGGSGAIGEIRSRQDAIRALDAVAEFFRKNEPSSPVPLFAERAKRLVSKNFLEVLADVAPDGLAQARSVGGVPSGES